LTSVKHPFYDCQILRNPLYYSVPTCERLPCKVRDHGEPGDEPIGPVLGERGERLDLGATCRPSDFPSRRNRASALRSPGDRLPLGTGVVIIEPFGWPDVLWRPRSMPARRAGRFFVPSWYSPS
jgi:hypothetical protein